MTGHSFKWASNECKCSADNRTTVVEWAMDDEAEGKRKKQAVEACH